MLIKQKQLKHYPLPVIYLLTGKDHYLLAETATLVKQIWQAKFPESEESIFYINHAADWEILNEKAHSYCLFAPHLLIDIRYEKQTLDASGKHFFTHYLKNPNSDYLLLIRAPHLALKQLQGFAPDKAIHIVQIVSLDSAGMQNWIKEQLKQRAIQFDPKVPELIHYYTQGNMLACAQAIEKIHLSTDNNPLSLDEAKAQLHDQCQYQLFDLSEAYLLQKGDKVIQQLHYAANTNTEPTLVLWLLAQDIRLLLQLNELTQSMAFDKACQQLKIWAQRAKFYQAAVKRLSRDSLIRLLQFCRKVDDQIKSNQTNLIWINLENIALTLCLGKILI